jgi:hypothetical protein
MQCNSFFSFVSLVSFLLDLDLLCVFLCFPAAIRPQRDLLTPITEQGLHHPQSLFFPPFHVKLRLRFDARLLLAAAVR